MWIANASFVRGESLKISIKLSWRNKESAWTDKRFHFDVSKIVDEEFLERVAQILFCHKETIQRRQGVLVTLKPLKNQWKGRETESLCWTMQTGRCRCQDVSNFGDIFIVCTKSDNTSSNDDFEDLTRDSNLVRVHGLWIAVMASFYCYWIGSSRHWSSLFFSEISLIVNSASS